MSIEEYPQLQNEYEVRTFLERASFLKDYCLNMPIEFLCNTATNYFSKYFTSADVRNLIYSITNKELNSELYNDQ